jgi:hypothetical protein
MGHLKKRKYRLKNHRTSEVEQLKRRYIQRYHMTLKEKVMKKRTRGNLGIGKGGGYSNTSRRDIQDITYGHQTTN